MHNRKIDMSYDMDGGQKEEEKKGMRNEWRILGIGKSGLLVPEVVAGDRFVGSPEPAATADPGKERERHSVPPFTVLFTMLLYTQ